MHLRLASVSGEPDVRTGSIHPALRLSAIIRGPSLGHTDCNQLRRTGQAHRQGPQQRPPLDLD